jgi:hypothetical protein
MPLDNKQMVVRSQQLPSAAAQPKFWKTFIRFVRDADEVLDHYEAICGHQHNETPDELAETPDWLQQLLTRCRAGLETFDRDELYEGDEPDRALRPETISTRLGVMFDAVGTTNPANPSTFLAMAVDHVAALDGLTALALESACREIVETHKFCGISELIKVTKAHIELWDRRLDAITFVEKERLRVRESLIAQRERQKKAEHDEKVRQTTFDAKNAMAKTQELAKKVDEAKERLAKLTGPEAEASLAERIEERIALMKEVRARFIEQHKAALMRLTEEHTASEKRESELMRELRKLTGEAEGKKDAR